LKGKRESNKLDSLKTLRFDLQKNYCSDLKNGLLVQQQINPNMLISHPNQQTELSSNIIIIKGFAKGASALVKNQTKAPLMLGNDTYATITDNDSLIGNYDDTTLCLEDKKQQHSFSNINHNPNLSKKKILEIINNQFFTYANAKWSLNLRKEVFSPNEKLDTPSAVDLIFMQIIRDFNSNDCVRISELDRQKLIEFLDSRGLSVSFLYEQYKSFKVKFKTQLIEMAKDYWPLYFCRLFPIDGYNEYEMLGVSHAGIMFVNWEKSSLNESLIPTQHYSLWEIREVNVQSENTLNLIVNTSEKKSILIQSKQVRTIKKGLSTIEKVYKITLELSKAVQIKAMIDSYLDELDKVLNKKNSFF
jgi:hypothetical protein